MPAGLPRKTWLLIDESDTAFGQTGLKKTSLLKAEKIAIVHETVFQRKLGKLSQAYMTQAEEALKKALLLS